MVRRFAVGVFAVLLAADAAAQIKPTAPVFVLDLFDPDHHDRFVVVSASSFNQALAKFTDSGDLATPLEGLADSCQGPKPDEVPKKLAKLLNGLQGCVECLGAFQEKRFVTDRNDQVMLIVLYDAGQIRPEQIRPFFEEKPRDSELVATAKALARLIKSAEPKETAGLWCEAFPYTLQRKRSRLKVTVPVPPRPARGSNTPRAPATEPTELIDTRRPAPQSAAVQAGAESPEVTLGPTERWFLSADFSISKAAVQFGNAPTPGAEELESKDFFVGLNFALGDLLADRESPQQRRNALKDLLIKLQVTPTREPWSAWAVGIGLRGYRIKTILWNMDVVHPYFTIGPQTQENGERRWRAALGFGFDPRSIGGDK